MAHMDRTPLSPAPRPRRGPHAAAVCRCQDAVAITVLVAAGHVATLRVCQWCGDSWDIDGTPAPPEAVHSLVPQPRSTDWRCNRPATRARRRADRVARARVPD